MFDIEKQCICLIGFSHPDEVVQIRPFVVSNPDQQIMIAAIANAYGTVDGSIRYDLPVEINRLFEHDPSLNRLASTLQNVLYFSTDQPDDLLNQLRSVIDTAGLNTDSILINVPWPNPEDLEVFRYEYPHVKLFIKVGPEAYARVRNRPRKLSQELRKYRGLVHRIILKPRERGVYDPFNPDQIMEILEVLHQDNQFEIGVAGGLDAADKKMIRVLLHEYPGLGIFVYRKLFNEDCLFCIEKAVTDLTGLLKICACS